MPPIVVIIFLQLPFLAHTQTIHSVWTGGVGEWTTPENWIHTPADPNADYPDNDTLLYNAEITSGEVTLNGAFTLERLSISGGHLLSGNLTLNGGLHTSGNLVQFSGGQIAMSGTSVWHAANFSLADAVGIDNLGVILLGDIVFSNHWDGSLLNNHGILRKSSGSGVATFSGEAQFNSFGSILVETGTLRIAQAGTIANSLCVSEQCRLEFAPPFGNLNFDDVTLEGPGTIAFTTGWAAWIGSATNNTSLQVSNSEFFGFGPFINNSNTTAHLLSHGEWSVNTINFGLLSIEGPQASLSSQLFENYGLIEIRDAQYRPFIILEARVLNRSELRSTVDAVVDLGSSVRVDNEGLVHVTAGTMHLSGGGTHSGAFRTASNAFLVFQNGHTFAEGASFTGNVRFVNSLATITGNATNFGTLESVDAIRGPGTLYIADGATLAWSGEMAGTGQTVILPGGLLTLSDLGFLFDRTIINEGTMRCYQQLYGNGGQIVNRGQLLVEDNFTFESFSFLASPILQNDGAISISYGSQVNLRGVIFTNNGTVFVGSATLNISNIPRPSHYVQNSGYTIIRRGTLLADDISILGGALSLDGTNSCNVLRVDSTLSLTADSILAARQLILTNTSVVEFEIGPAGPAAVSLDPGPRLDGTLRLRLTQGFVPPLGTRYTLLRNLAYEHLFRRYEGVEIGNGLRLVPHYNSSDLQIVVLQAPAAGQNALRITRSFTSVDLSWPPEFAGYYLQSTTNLAHPNWVTEHFTWTNTPSLPMDAPQRFFRLFPPP